MGSDTDERLARLETHVAFQDKLLEELNGVIITMRGQLDAATARLADAESRLDALRERVGEGGAADEKPPHY